jgi:5'-3' exonuclease
MDLIDAVDPGDLIFIAVDGVAPRAKINQSRDRRFKSKKDSASFAEFLKKLGVEDKENFKENSISPGTEFLVNLCDKLRMYVMSMMETEWRHLKVFFSDCLVPGEGEHKIMDFLRESQSLKLFHPETTYCIYSPDADVILLSLTLDQQNVCLIR